MSSENELKIRGKIVDLNTEISNILKTEGDFRNANLSEFFKLVSFLQHVNDTTPAPGIHDAIDNLIKSCHFKRETREQYDELLELTQQFIDRIKL